MRSRWASTLSDTKLIVSPLHRYPRDTLSSRGRANHFHARLKLLGGIAQGRYCRLAAREFGSARGRFMGCRRVSLPHACARLILALEAGGNGARWRGTRL